MAYNIDGSLNLRTDRSGIYRPQSSNILYHLAYYIAINTTNNVAAK